MGIQLNIPLFDMKRDSFTNLWYDESMESKANAPQIALHCRVLVELVDSTGGVERREFTIVPGKLADFKSGLLDENTPLGHALMGHGSGETIPYQAGDLVEVRILAVAAGKGSLSSDAAEERRADVQKAVAQSEITNQMIFSTASGSKWGDYDVDMDKLLKDDDKKTTLPEK
jgi:Transcription elongation factor, GreA/GreB, C-term.